MLTPYAAAVGMACPIEADSSSTVVLPLFCVCTSLSASDAASDASSP